ncbi:MAG: hypothetical protein IPI43_14330 [Sandaracinaceae bacterium]|nr:hypothetical protein [Sandaracinaceae bacterium]
MPGLTYEDACARLSRVSEPVLGQVSVEHVQLCPQSSGVLDAERATQLRESMPETRSRLHANVRVEPERVLRDATHVRADPGYFASLGRVHHALGSDVYSLHAGRRGGPVDTLEQVFDNVRHLEDALGSTVAVEGLYPDARRSFFLDDWSSYASLLESPVHFAIDLSHLHIVATRWRSLPRALVHELLACERCVEVHVSDNDGFRDQHRVLTHEPWWWSFLSSVHPSAVVFTEANHRSSPTP